MERTNKNKLMILAILFVLLSSWVIGNFLYLMINTTTDSEPAIISPDKIRKSLQEDYDYSLFDLLFAVFIIIIIIILSITIIGILVEPDMALLTQISVIIVVILVATTIFSFNVSESQKDPNGVIPDSNDIDIPGGQNIIEKTSPYGHIIFPLIIIGIFFLLVSEIRKGRKRKGPHIDNIFEKEEKEEETIKAGLSSDFEILRNELIKGKGVREAIIKAYSNMINIFKKEGIDFEPSMTSREFMDYALRNLDVSDETISDITNIFEEARYSSHKLDELYREQILNDLKKLEEELEER